MAYELERSDVRPGEWLVILGHDPADLGQHAVSVGGTVLPALFEEDRMMVRCPEYKGRLPVKVDGHKVGVITYR